MFYDNLKAECDRQGIKITPLVLECGGKAGSIGGWKKGSNPNSDIVMKIAVRLNVSTDYLLFGKNNEEDEQELDEKELISAFRSMTIEGRKAALSYVLYLADDKQYKKITDVPREA